MVTWKRVEWYFQCCFYFLIASNQKPTDCISWYSFWFLFYRLSGSRSSVDDINSRSSGISWSCGNDFMVFLTTLDVLWSIGFSSPEISLQIELWLLAKCPSLTPYCWNNYCCFILGSENFFQYSSQVGWTLG